MKRYRIYKTKTTEHKSRNALAKELEDKKFKPRVVRPDKMYDRSKDRKKVINLDEDTEH